MYFNTLESKVVILMVSVDLVIPCDAVETGVRCLFTATPKLVRAGVGRRRGVCVSNRRLIH
jgi:hypothetical protein